MNCPKCGTAVPDKSRFCPECGAVFNDALTGKKTAVSKSSPKNAKGARVNTANNQSFDVQLFIKCFITAGLQLLLFLFWFVPSITFSGDTADNISVCDLLSKSQYQLQMDYITIFTILFSLASIGVLALPFVIKRINKTAVFLVQLICPVWTFIWLMSAFSKAAAISAPYSVSVYFSLGGCIMLALILGVIAVSAAFAVMAQTGGLSESANRVDTQAVDTRLIIKSCITVGLQLLLFIFWFIPSITFSVITKENYSVIDILSKDAFHMDLRFITVFSLLLFLVSASIFILPFINKNMNTKPLYYVQLLYPVWTLVWLFGAFTRANEEKKTYGITNGEVVFSAGGWIIVLLCSVIIVTSVVFAVLAKKAAAERDTDSDIYEEAANPVSKQPLNIAALIEPCILGCMQLLLFLFWFVPTVETSQPNVGSEYNSIFNYTTFKALDFATVFAIMFFIISIMFVVPSVTQFYDKIFVCFMQALYPLWSLVWLITAYTSYSDFYLVFYKTPTYFTFGGWVLFALIAGVIATSVIFAAKPAKTNSVKIASKNNR